MFCCSRGCSLCASPPPLLEEKTCMISYMKDICNWTAGPMQYIYNSKQKTLKPVSSGSPPLSFFFSLLPEETYLHTFRNITSKKKKKNRQNAGYRSCYTLYISCECSECTSAARRSRRSDLIMVPGSNISAAASQRSGGGLELSRNTHL